ncbi:DedA family protein [Microcoleus sp. FACHB-1515]|uniref:DedA family protein n=1 Tax=Cyanophyceae TaxID=3028117 RepID=UPI001684E5CC|nr:DedA family protein [Microcoleus sp. FACHB-1515]MBD2090327.1 DedA family protein [Microcoleus sp. FACHB-1515]
MAEWITNVMTSLGYWGIGLLMFLENLFPPIPSELIMPLAGFTVARGEMNFFLAVLAGTIGTVLGALPWYYIGHFLGTERVRDLADRYGRWLTVTGKDIDRADRWFDRQGIKAVLIGRLIPGVRTLISLPAGISGMNLPVFLVFSTIGTVLWTTLLTAAGYFLGDNYELVDEYLAPVSKVIAAIIVVSFLFWVARRKLRST